MGIADRLRRIEQARAEHAARAADRPPLDRTTASARAAQLVNLAGTAGLKTPRARLAQRVAELIERGLVGYVCEHGTTPPEARQVRFPAAPAPDLMPAFDVLAELDRRAQQQEHELFDRLQERQCPHH